MTENSEKFLRVVDAFNRGDIDGMVDLLHPEIEWYPTPLADAQGAQPYYRGHQGIRDLVDDLRRAGIEIEARFSRVDDLGDHLIAVGEMQSRSHGGPSMGTPVAYLVGISDSMARCVRAFPDEQSARDAAG